MSAAKTPRPALGRRVVTYDLTDTEREAAQTAARDEGRTISRWVADAVRERLARQQPALTPRAPRR